MIVESTAPNRILDFGGWTDTHFADRGRVVNLAVTLFAHATLANRSEPGATIHILDYGIRLEIPDVAEPAYGTEHDLLLAALKALPCPTGLDVRISADVPPGCGTGGSAAITVAILSGLGVLTGLTLSSRELARLAHGIETEELGNECGVQDQIASAYGGLNYIAIDRYPDADVSPIPVSDPVGQALESGLLLVYEGAGHLSSDVHRRVIAGMARPGSGVARSLSGLSLCADRAKDALVSGDLAALAGIMNENNRLQKSLHPGITTERIERIEEIAMDKGAAGAMINGAGGGGSITLLCKPGARPVVAEALTKEGFTILPCSMAQGPAKAWIVG